MTPTQWNTTQKVRVPISYAPKEKFIARLNEGGSILEDKTKVKAILPRLGFDITGVNYDPTRTINKLKKMKKQDGALTTSAFNEVPYNISFGLYSFTSSIDENLQIIEQITPFFAPEFIVSINMNDAHEKVDVPIVLSNINIQEEYEGNFATRRFISTTFEFLAKSYMYYQSKLKDSQRAVLFFRSPETSMQILQTLQVMKVQLFPRLV